MFSYWFENCDIKLEILNKLAHWNQLETQITVMSEFFLMKVFSWPRNYYNDNKQLSRRDSITCHRENCTAMVANFRKDTIQNPDDHMESHRMIRPQSI